MEKSSKKLTEEQKQRLREWGRRGGRKPIVDKRNTRFSFRLREKDAVIFCKNVKESGLSIGEYIRQKMINDEDFFYQKREQENIILVLQELRKIGNNLNQVAHKLNLYKNPSETDEVLFELSREIKEVKEWLISLRVKQK